MAAELQASEIDGASFSMKRKAKNRKGNKPSKKPRPSERAAAKSKKPSLKMKKLFQKRAKEYDSDSEEADPLDPYAGLGFSKPIPLPPDRDDQGDSGDEEGGRDPDGEPDGDVAQQGITRFAEGCRAFKSAFTKIMSKKLPSNPLGPILLANKKLVAEKLAEEENEHKGKAGAKKEKILAAEKGHVMPVNFLNEKEKALISIGTKGVVKLFNAVNKAQKSQKNLNPSKSKDAKLFARRRKQTFLSELKKPTTEAVDNPSLFNTSKAIKSTSTEDDEQPGWAPLRDTYMLTNSKLKDWDKMPARDSVLDDHNLVPPGSSSDDE